VTDHLDVREALELAAVEPGGLDRLEAGDAPDAAAVVGHLAGCSDCLEEMARLRRAETLLRPIVAETPDPALRERTLAYVRMLGVARGAGAGPIGPPLGAPVSASVPTATTAEAPTLVETPAPADLTPVPRRRSVGLPAWAASVAAVLVVGVVGGALVGGGLVGGTPAGSADPAAVLDAVTREMAELEAAGDAREAALVDPAGRPAGMLVLSPSADRVVVAATGLAPAPPGSEHRCWVEVGGERRVLGTMRRAGSVEWWAGDVTLPEEIPPGVVYGISLVPEGADGPGSVVLSGEL
jgi:hypothetical protein